MIALLFLVHSANIHNSNLKRAIYTKFNDFLHQIFESTLKIDLGLSKITILQDYINLHKKYQNLQEENQTLKTTLHNQAYINEENNALKQLNKFVSGKGTLVLSGNLVINNPNTFSKEIRILAGTKHGVKEGQIVLDRHGLLGRVITVGEDVSNVLLITDTMSKISVIFPRVENKGILSGTYDNILEISLLDKENIPQPNDIVITSGDGGFFPPGLVVGHVLSAGSSSDIKVKPLFDISNLNFVSIVQY
jgi:rod shape-determining protein MreC